MKRRLQKWIVLTGLVCMMGLGIYGCGTSKGTEENQEPAEETEENQPEEEGKETEGSEPEAVPEDQAAGQSGAGEWKESEEDLTGDILELGEMQFTVVKLVSEDMEDGSATLIAPAEGADGSDFDQVTVLYDENTRFRLRTIYDGGARYEDSEASPKDLKAEAMVLVWGTYEENGETIRAEQIQIETVVH